MSRLLNTDWSSVATGHRTKKSDEMPHWTDRSRLLARLLDFAKIPNPISYRRNHETHRYKISS